MIDAEADKIFRSRARAFGLNPDNPWIGGYVDYEWDHGRHFLTAYAPDLHAATVLELGCNVGGSAVVLALLGASVTGIDIDELYVELAALNASRHGVRTARFHHLADSKALAFPDGSFDMVTCNSVLEYVAPDDLQPILREIDRVLIPGGLFIVAGTSNRLWPREVHSGRWFVNYLPRGIDLALGHRTPRPRGLSPWSVLRALPGYRQLCLEDGGKAYIGAHRAAGVRRAKLWGLAGIAALGPITRISAGMLTPSFFLALRKGGPVR